MAENKISLLTKA